MDRNILIDAGPLIALFSSRDSYHQKALDFIKNCPSNLWTTWPVITEASHMLDFSIRAQINLLTWIQRGGIRMMEIEKKDIQDLIRLTEKYSDVPMDLADASLIVAADIKGFKQIASIDGDFYNHRTIRNRYLENIFI